MASGSVTNLATQVLYASTTVQVSRFGNVIVCAFTDATISDISTALQNIEKPTVQVRTTVWNFSDASIAVMSVSSSSVIFIQPNPWGAISDPSKIMHGQIVWII